MSLLVSSLKKEISTLKKNNIKLQAIGNLDQLPNQAQSQLKEVIRQTRENSHMTLSLALKLRGPGRTD